MDKLYDYIIIGSGFGGSVSAMRLAEKGYSVLVLEKGKEFKANDFPKSDWNIRKYLWAPLLKCFGIMKLTFFKEVFVLSGVGVGGGSLVYANTHMIPPDEFFKNPVWGKLKDWKKELMPYYDKAKFMLGTVKVDRFYEEDYILKDLAKDMGKEESFGGVNVGVYYGDTKKAVDPYFNGLGPERTGCVECAGCMIGCRHGAKNSLDKNYLYFARKFGAKIQAETLVSKVEYKDKVYHIHTQSSSSWFSRKKQIFKAKGLVISGGVLGTMDLLLNQKHGVKTLPKLSERLGENFRTNSEMLCGITMADQKLNHGIAISSVFNPDPSTHIEIVKYPNGSGAMGKLGVFATENGPSYVRTLKLLGKIITHPIKFLKVFANTKFASNSIILLVMQTLDSAMKMRWKKGWFGKGKIKLDNSGNERVPVFIDVGQEVLHRYAEKVNGVAMNGATEILFSMSSTAHVLGGCPMGDSPEEGVVNQKFQAHGYPNMYILDGSIIPCNLGVNPSLTITALSEYAMAQVPEKEGNTVKSLAVQMENAG